MKKVVATMRIQSDVTEHFVQIDNVLNRLRELGYSLSKEDCTHIVLRENELVGAFHLDEFYIPTPNKSIRLNWMVVTKSSEESGYKVGRFILGEIITRFQMKGFKAMYLSVKKTNSRAIHLYKSFGFQNNLNSSYQSDSEQDMILTL